MYIACAIHSIYVVVIVQCLQAVVNASGLFGRLDVYCLQKTCISVVPCPTNLAIPDGIVKFSEDGRSVTYQCVDKFKLVGSASAECKEDGTWNSPPPKCSKSTKLADNFIIAYM